MSATDDGSGHLVLAANSPNTTFTASGADQTAFGLSSSGVSGTSSTRTTLQSNYNSLLTQIDQLASDASYNGVNLLNGNNLKVLFNENGTSSLTITGVTFNAAGLGLFLQFLPLRFFSLIQRDDLVFHLFTLGDVSGDHGKAQG